MRPTRRTPSCSDTPRSPRTNSLRVKRNCVTSGCAIVAPSPARAGTDTPLTRLHSDPAYMAVDAFTRGWTHSRSAWPRTPQRGLGRWFRRPGDLRHAVEESPLDIGVDAPIHRGCLEAA